jgi:hypothetical protein
MSSGVCIWYSVSSTGGPVQSLACVGLRAPVCGPCAPCGERFTTASCSVPRKNANMVHFLLVQWYIEVTNVHSPRPLASTRQARALDSPRHHCVETSEGLTGNCMLAEVPPTAKGGSACATPVGRAGKVTHHERALSVADQGQTVRVGPALVPRLMGRRNAGIQMTPRGQCGSCTHTTLSLTWWRRPWPQSTTRPPCAWAPCASH